MIILPTTPAAWAIKLSQLLQHIQISTGESMYPIKVQEIACDISKHFFPSEPLVRVCGDTFSTEFDGMMSRTTDSGGSCITMQSLRGDESILRWRMNSAIICFTAPISKTVSNADAMR